jgi:hypothetical protein
MRCADSSTTCPRRHVTTAAHGPQQPLDRERSAVVFASRRAGMPNVESR